MQGIDLFSGAGGMSMGAINSGIDVKFAVELDKYAAKTFIANHPNTKLYNDDIRNISAMHLVGFDRTKPLIIFGGPPCQGFSTSNQKNRDKANQNNWLYREYVRLVDEIRPDWVLFENVKGLLETESGFFLDEVIREFRALGYTVSYFILNSADYGVPQKRNRLFVVGSLHGIEISSPPKTATSLITVSDAFADLPDLVNGDVTDFSAYKAPARSKYAQLMRGNLNHCWNNLVTRNAEYVLERYSHIAQGGNWQDIPSSLMENYKDASRCHTGIYHRLKQDEPSVVIGNFRKNMLVHPTSNRGLSVREAARLQSIPDHFRFMGSIGFQQQQVGNLVPPLLAEAVFKQIAAA